MKQIENLQKEINNILKELIKYNNISIDSLNELELLLNKINIKELDDNGLGIIELAKLIVDKYWAVKTIYIFKR